MSGINKVILIGNLGRDPEVKYTPNGIAVATFSIATSEAWKDKNSGEKQERTEWHKIVAWRKLAEICGEYLSKGSRVYIEGKLQTRSWQDKSHQDITHYMTEIIAQDIQFLTPKGSSSGGQSYSEPPPGQGPAHGPEQGQAYPKDEDDDIPF